MTDLFAKSSWAATKAYEGEIATPHILILSEIFEYDGFTDRDYEVVHPHDCPYEIVYDFNDEGDLCRRRVHTCFLSFEIEQIGLDSLDDWKTKLAGEYFIRGWSHYYPAEYGGSADAEWDGGIKWVD